MNSPLLQLLLETVRAIPEAEGLDEKVLQQICQQAIAQGTAQNRQWLLDHLEQAQRHAVQDGTGEGDSVGMIPSSGEASATPAEKKTFTEIPVSRPTQITSPSDLEAILIRHGDWIQSVLHPDAAIAAGRANFSSADLNGFELDGLDLRGAVFKGTLLQGASLQRTNLTTANFENADLSGANLQGAKLKRANLQGANLTGARLNQADLRGARLKGAIWDGASLVDALVDDPGLLQSQLKTVEAANADADPDTFDLETEAEVSPPEAWTATAMPPPEPMTDATACAAD